MILRQALGGSPSSAPPLLASLFALHRGVTVYVWTPVLGAVKAGYVLRSVRRSGDVEVHLGGAWCGRGASSGGIDREGLAARHTRVCQQKEEEKL